MQLDFFLKIVIGEAYRRGLRDLAPTLEHYEEQTNRRIRVSHSWMMLQVALESALDSKSPIPSVNIMQAQEQSLAERLEDDRLKARLSIEEHAHAIGISRSTYFEVKGGRSGKRSKRLAEIYLDRLK
jgi:hypothetical protein